MDRASGRRIGYALARVGALAFLCLTAACGTVDPGYSIVTQDKFDFMTCREIVGNRAALIAREKELADLVEKTDASPGGILVSLAAYRSELASARTQLSVANRAAREKGCDAAPKP